MIRLLGDRVLVALKPDPDEIVSPGGIVLTRDPDRASMPTQGIVVALGEKQDVVERMAILTEVANGTGEVAGATLLERLGDLAPAPFDVAVNDCVLFSKAVGEEIEEDGVRYVILREADILGVVEPIKKDEAA